MPLKIDMKEAKEIAIALVQLRERAFRANLLRTAHLIDIPAQEIGWEMQGLLSSPEWARERQKETLQPFIQ